MKKKGIALLLAVAICAGMSAGCGSSGFEGAESGSAAQSVKDPEAPLARETTVTSILSYTSPSANCPEGLTPETQYFCEKAKEKYNINVKFLWSAPEDQYEQKFAVAMASGDLPDVFAVGEVDYATLLENDQIMSWNEALSYADETLLEWIYRDPEIIESVTNADGEIMSLPQYWDTKRNMNILMIRKDWLDQVGMDVPTTPEELEKVALAFRNELGAQAPISLTEDIIAIYGTSPMSALMNMWGSYPGAWIRGEDGTLVPGEIQEETRTALEELNRFYEEGLVSGEFALTSTHMLRESILSDDTGILIAPWWACDIYCGVSMAQDEDCRWVTAPLPASEESKGALMASRDIEQYWVMSKDCESPEAVMKLFNVFAEVETTDENATPENGYVWNWNPVSFFDPYDVQELHDVFNAQIATGDLETVPENIRVSDMELWSYAPDYYRWKAGEIPYNQDNLWGKYLSRIDEDGAWGTTSAVVEAGKYELNEFYGEATPTMVDRQSTLDKISEETFLKIVMGEQSVDTFDQYVENWLSLGGEKMIEEINVRSASKEP